MRKESSAQRFQNFVRGYRFVSEILLFHTHIYTVFIQNYLQIMLADRKFLILGSLGQSSSSQVSSCWRQGIGLESGPPFQPEVVARFHSEIELNIASNYPGILYVSPSFESPSNRHTSQLSIIQVFLL